MLCDHDPCNEISSLGHHWWMCDLSKNLSSSLWLLFSNYEIELFTHIEWGKLQPSWGRRRQGKWMKPYREWAYTHSSASFYHVHTIKVVATSHSCDLWLHQFSFILDPMWWMTNQLIELAQHCTGPKCVEVHREEFCYHCPLLTSQNSSLLCYLVTLCSSSHLTDLSIDILLLSCCWSPIVLWTIATTFFSPGGVLTTIFDCGLFETIVLASSHDTIHKFVHCHCQ